MVQELVEPMDRVLEPMDRVLEPTVNLYISACCPIPMLTGTQSAQCMHCTLILISGDRFA